jgi:hypothetical protein
VSDQQPAASNPDLEGEAAAPAMGAGDDWPNSAPALELDFSRLEKARASLDAAFPEG